MMQQKHRYILAIYGEEKTFYLSGRLHQAMQALLENKQRGITALEVSSWAFRLAAYIHLLRTEYGLDIATVSEPHEGGKHARYFLRDDVRLVHA
jgi:hypothetical protein